jgi:acyl carrier protein
MSTEESLRDFIVEDLGWGGDPAQLTGDYDLLENGVIDSIGVFQLVSLIEERLGVEVPDDDLVPENFASVAALARMVDAHRASA